MLADILHKVAEFENEEYRYNPRPSLAGPERCIRYLDYYAQGYEKRAFPGRFLTVIDDSSWHEQLIKDWIRKSAFQIHSEQMGLNITDDQRLSFMGERFCKGCGEVIPACSIHTHLDGIFTDILGIDRVLEIKAISHFGFMEIWGGGLPMDYITQTFLEIRAVKEVNPEITESLLFVKNKNQAQYLEIRLIYESASKDVGLIEEMTLSTGEMKRIGRKMKEVTRSALDKFKEVEEYRKAKKIHDRPYEMDSWRCQYCQFGELCWENWKAEFEARAKDTKLSGEAEEMARYYLECAMHIEEMKSEKEELKNRLRKLMSQKRSQRAIAGAYFIMNQVLERSRVNQEKIPPRILKKAIEKVPYEDFRIYKKESKAGERAGRKVLKKHPGKTVLKKTIVIKRKGKGSQKSKKGGWRK